MFQELPMLESHSDLVKHALDAVADVFSGELLVEQHTTGLLARFPEIPVSGDMSRYEAHCGDYWDWEHEDGRKAIIGYSWWPGQSKTTYSASDNLGIEYSSDIEHMTTQIVGIWQNLVNYHRSRYPGQRIVFSEVGIYNFGNQEMANMWEAYLRAMERMRVDGFAVWNTEINSWPWGGYGLHTGWSEIYGEPVISAITPFLE